ncbi:MAG: hypothetical protein ACOX2O_04595 [Bdellovibrionota bacterium]|jgi:hypothetical protein
MSINLSSTPPNHSQGSNPSQGSSPESSPLEEASLPNVDDLLARLKFYAKIGNVDRTHRYFDLLREHDLLSAEELEKLQSCLLSARKNGIQHLLQCFKEYAQGGDVGLALKTLNKITQYEKVLGTEKAPATQEWVDELFRECLAVAIPSAKYKLNKIVKLSDVEILKNYAAKLKKYEIDLNIDLDVVNVLKAYIADADQFKNDLELYYVYAKREMPEEVAQFLKDSYKSVRQKSIEIYLKISEEQVKDGDSRNLSPYLEEIKRLAEECGLKIVDTLK